MVFPLRLICMPCEQFNDEQLVDFLFPLMHQYHTDDIMHSFTLFMSQTNFKIGITLNYRYKLIGWTDQNLIKNTSRFVCVIVMAVWIEHPITICYTMHGYAEPLRRQWLKDSRVFVRIKYWEKKTKKSDFWFGWISITILGASYVFDCVIINLPHTSKNNQQSIRETWKTNSITKSNSI